MKKFRSTSSYNRKNPKTGLIEQTSRWIEGTYTNKQACEAELAKQIKVDDVIGRVVFDTRKIE